MNRLQVSSFFFCVVVAIAHPFARFASGAGVITTFPNLPSLEGFYTYNVLGQPHFASYQVGGLQVVLAIDFQPLGVVTTNYTIDPNEHDDFSMSASGLISINGSAGEPTTANGTASEVEFGKGSTTITGTFDTEMLSLNLSGTSTFGPYKIRRDTSVASKGQTSVTSIGGGKYLINSFFDVFTELSLDNGNNWFPSIVSTRIALTSTPEPATATLVGLGLMGMIGFARRRR